MKCTELDQMSLARAFKSAKDSVGGHFDDVDMDALAPHLKEQGSSCGTCPALLPLAQKAFEDLKGKLKAEEMVAKKGICGHARRHKYTADGIPDLLGPAIDGEPI